MCGLGSCKLLTLRSQMCEVHPLVWYRGKEKTFGDLWGRNNLLLCSLLHFLPPLPSDLTPQSPSLAPCLPPTRPQRALNQHTVQRMRWYTKYNGGIPQLVPHQPPPRACGLPPPPLPSSGGVRPSSAIRSSLSQWTSSPWSLVAPLCLMQRVEGPLQAVVG